MRYLDEDYLKAGDCRLSGLGFRVKGLGLRVGGSGRRMKQ